MEERSGDLVGHCNTLKLWMRKMSWVCLAACERALSCWKFPTLCCCKYGTTTGSIIPSRQRNAKVGTARFQSSGVYPVPDCPVAHSCASSIREWGLLALYRHKEILVNSSLKASLPWHFVILHEFCEQQIRQQKIKFALVFP